MYLEFFNAMSHKCYTLSEQDPYKHYITKEKVTDSNTDSYAENKIINILSS